jgi:(p)ppGpp synthase/HD superfamily hydrolase
MFSPSIERALSLSVLAHDELIQAGTNPSGFPVRPLHVALMLARWEQDEDVIVAALAHGVAAGAPAWTAQRVEQQFGRHVAALVEELDGSPTLDALARSQDGLERIARLSPQAATILAVEALHELHRLHAELREARDPDAVWSRFFGGSSAALAGAEALVQALGRRIEPRVSRALGAALRALIERSRTASVGPRS